jgi:hypothetical protein
MVGSNKSKKECSIIFQNIQGGNHRRVLTIGVLFGDVILRRWIVSWNASK